MTQTPQGLTAQHLICKGHICGHAAFTPYRSREGHILFTCFHLYFSLKDESENCSITYGVNTDERTRGSDSHFLSATGGVEEGEE